MNVSRAGPFQIENTWRMCTSLFPAGRGQHDLRDQLLVMPEGQRCNAFFGTRYWLQPEQPPLKHRHSTLYSLWTHHMNIHVLSFLSARNDERRVLRAPNSSDLSSWMSTLYTFWGNTIPYRTESVHFLLGWWTQQRSDSGDNRTRSTQEVLSTAASAARHSRMGPTPGWGCSLQGLMVRRRAFRLARLRVF